MKQTVLTFLVALAAGALNAADSTNDYMNAELPNAKRIAAAKAIADVHYRAGDTAKAAAVLRACYDFPKLKSADRRTVAERLARYCRTEDNLQAAEGVWREAQALSEPELAASKDRGYVVRERTAYTAAIADVLADRGDREGAYRLLLDRGVYTVDRGKGALDRAPDDKTLEDLCFRILDGGTNYTVGVKKTAFTKLYLKRDRRMDDRAFDEKYLPLFMVGDKGPQRHEWVSWWLKDSLVWWYGDTAPFYGDHAQTLRTFENLRRYYAKFPKSFAKGEEARVDVTTYAAMAAVGLGQRDRAVGYIDEIVADMSTNLVGATAYQLKFMRAFIPAKGSVQELEVLARRLDGELAGKLDPKERFKRLNRVGTCMMLDHAEDHARALEQYMDSCLKHPAKRRYTVKYSAKSVDDANGFDRLDVKPEVQLMDRQFGGTFEFLATDVSTGDRSGVSAETQKKRIVPPELRVVADDWGLHFRVDIPLEAEHLAKLRKGFERIGQFEGYLAPGFNQPYNCLLFSLDGNSLKNWHTSYDTFNARRIDKDAGLFRNEVKLTERGVAAYFAYSWACYATLVPEAGTVWEFENIYWGAKGNAAWNGCKTVHGRSGWGELVFDLTASDRASILRRQLVRARNVFNRSKWWSHHEVMPLDYWKDGYVGDPKFYEAELKPWVETLDKLGEKMKPDMSEEDIVELSEKALPQWHDYRSHIARKRVNYIRRQLTE